MDEDQPPSPPRPRYNPRKKDDFILELSNRFDALEVDYFETADPETAATTLQDILISSACTTMGTLNQRQRLPGKRNGGVNQPWWDEEMDGHRAYLLQMETQYGQGSTEQTAALEAYKRAIMAKKRAHKRAQMRLLIDGILGHGDAVQAWRMFRGHEDPAVTPQLADFVETFKPQYEQADPAPPDSGLLFHGSKTIPGSAQAAAAADFSAEEIERAIDKLKNGRAADQHGLRAEFLKLAADELLDILTDLFNNFLRNGFPPSLSTCFLHPIYKKGDRLDPGNYRAIAIIDILSKLYATCLNDRVTAACETIRAKGQAGFRRDHRTTDHIFTLEACRLQATIRGRRLYTCFVDFAKAFDSVSRSLLFSRLSAVGLPLRLISAVESYYAATQCRVRADGKFSPYFPYTIGVKQGCPLSPTLFGVFIDFFEDFIAARLTAAPADNPPSMPY
jgi:hypothetical protein